jgi:hypothetical protein
MKSIKCIKLWLIALCLVVGTAGLASADLLVEYQGTTYYQSFTGTSNQPLAKVVVGAADVAIGSFGVYGQAQVAGNVKWLIFDSLQLSSPVYLSAAQAVAGNPGTFAAEAQWYDSPELDFTLLAGHTYAMGLIADQVSTFRWGSSPDTPFGPWPSIVGDGLTLPFTQKLDNSGVVSGVFTNTPTLYAPYADSSRSHPSLRVFSPAPPPVPVPPTVLLLGSGLVGLLGLGRRRFSNK